MFKSQIKANDKDELEKSYMIQGKLANKSQTLTKLEREQSL